MNIILDNIIFSLQRVGGISVYWYELLSRLKRDGRSMQVIEHSKSSSNIFRMKLTLDQSLIIEERSKFPLKISRYFPYSVFKVGQTLYHSSYYRKPELANTTNIVTVYDFTYERFPHGMSCWAHSMQKKAAMKTANGIICISESTRRDLLELYPEISASKIQVIHLGVSEQYKPIKLSELELMPSELLDSPFVLFVGSRSSYKNFHLALEVLAGLPNYWFVSVGGGALKSKEAELSQRLLPGRHMHFPLLDNERLNSFYNCAHALLFPSIYEGFGIPIIESMAAGCPVIVSNASAIPEACGNAGLLVNEIRPETFADQILKLENDEFRSEIIEKGYAQAGRFSWEACYVETIAFYERVLQGNI